MEDKKKILKGLLLTLRSTRRFEDLRDLVYSKNDDGMEFVTCIYENGSYYSINVTMDSGIAMIRDVLRGLC